MRDRTAHPNTRTEAGLLPGLAACLVVGGVAVVIESGLASFGLRSVSAIAVALLLGMGMAAAGLVPETSRDGVRVSVRYGLKWAITLLGFRFSLGVVTTIGSRALAVIGVVIVVSFSVAIVVSLLTGVDRRLALLIGAGTGICGNSAIAAVAPSIRASDSQITFASATITLFGTLAMITLPLLGALLDLSATQFGILAGAGVHDSAQAIASGFLFGEEAGNMATMVKLARTAFLVPAVWLVSVAARRDPQLAGGDRSRTRWWSLVPLFVVGFILAAAIRTLGDEMLSGPVWLGLIHILRTTADVLLVVAMAGVGLRTQLGELRQLGARPLVVGLLSAVAASGAALSTIGALRLAAS